MDRKIEAQRMHDTGISYRAIGRAFGVRHNTVICWLDPEARERRRVYAAGWRDTHKVEEKICTAKYRAKHKQMAETYRSTHKTEIAKISAAYARAHPAKYAAYTAKYRALKEDTTLGNLEEIKEIYRQAQETLRVRCYLCGKLIPLGHRHVDHITPLSKGGVHRSSNLAVACDHCNLSKQAKMPEEMGILI